MPLLPGEVVVSSGPALVNGVRNKFLDIVVEMLRDADIPARLATLSDIGSEHQPERDSHGDFEPCFVLVPEAALERARYVNLMAEDCRICVQCEAYIKPGLKNCPGCGVRDERNPAEIHAAYNAAMTKHFSEK